MVEITKNGVTRFCSKHGLDKWLRLGYKVVENVESEEFDIDLGGDDQEDK